MSQPTITDPRAIRSYIRRLMREASAAGVRVEWDTDLEAMSVEALRVYAQLLKAQMPARMAA